MHRRNISQRIFVVCSVLSVDYSHQCTSVNELSSALCICQFTITVQKCPFVYHYIKQCASADAPVASSVDLSLQYHQHCLSTITCTSSLHLSRFYIPCSVHLSRHYDEQCASVKAILSVLCICQLTVPSSVYPSMLFSKVCICHWFN
jgi:hypothetical protein